MTRVDLYEEISELSFQKANVIAIEDCQYLIDKVYDNFENRTCKNCYYCECGYCYNEDIQKWSNVKRNVGVYIDFTYLDNFGCNRFKPKIK